MKKIVFLMLMLNIVFCFTGCAAPFAAGTLVGGSVSSMVVNDRRCINTITEDQTIHYLAGLRLKSCSKLNHTRVVVAVFNHQVLLVGEVHTQAQRQLAERIVKSVPRVKRVYNALTLGEPLSPYMQSQDTWITTKVRTNFVANVDLNANQLKVVTENGSVYLMGIVTEHQADVATLIASHTSDVRRVVKLFEYAQVPPGSK